MFSTAAFVFTDSFKLNYKKCFSIHLYVYLYIKEFLGVFAAWGEADAKEIMRN